MGTKVNVIARLLKHNVNSAALQCFLSLVYFSEMLPHFLSLSVFPFLPVPLISVLCSTFFFIIVIDYDD